MAKNRYINTKFWSDGWVRKLNPLDRYLFLYLLTNEHANISGIYELSLDTMSFESGIDIRDLIDSMLPRLKPKTIYCKEWVIFPNFLKHQNQGSPKVQEGILRELMQVPEEILQKAIEYGYPIHTLSYLTKLNLTKEDTKINFGNSIKNMKNYEEPQINLEGEVLISPVQENQNKKWAEFLAWWKKKLVNLGVKSYNAQIQDKVLFHKRIKELGKEKFTKVILFYLASERVERLLEGEDQIPTIAAALSTNSLNIYNNR